MNYLKQIKGFYLRRRLHPLTSSAITLYYLLLEQFNLVGFPQYMSIPLSRLMGESNLGKTAVCRARAELVASGYLNVKTSYYRTKSAVYSIVTIDPDEFAGAKASETKNAASSVPLLTAGGVL